MEGDTEKKQEKKKNMSDGATKKKKKKIEKRNTNQQCVHFFRIFFELCIVKMCFPSGKCFFVSENRYFIDKTAFCWTCLFGFFFSFFCCCIRDFFFFSEIFFHRVSFRCVFYRFSPIFFVFLCDFRNLWNFLHVFLIFWNKIWPV
jgi:hypothetical protein